MEMRFAWLHAIRQAMMAPAISNDVVDRRPMSFGIGHCSGCERLRATDSSTCSHCGSTAPVAADA
jgi:hypothetical protein